MKSIFSAMLVKQPVSDWKPLENSGTLIKHKKSSKKWQRMANSTYRKYVQQNSLTQ